MKKIILTCVSLGLFAGISYAINPQLPWQLTENQDQNLTITGTTLPNPADGTENNRVTADQYNRMIRTINTFIDRVYSDGDSLILNFPLSARNIIVTNVLPAQNFMFVTDTLGSVVSITNVDVNQFSIRDLSIPRDALPNDSVTESNVADRAVGTSQIADYELIASKFNQTVAKGENISFGAQKGISSINLSNGNLSSNTSVKDVWGDLSNPSPVSSASSTSSSSSSTGGSCSYQDCGMFAYRDPARCACRSRWG